MHGEPIIEWEPVLTVHEYYDGPRNGIAEYRGRAHAYKGEWDEALGDWSTEFLLSPIDDEQLAVIKEDWQIWRRYAERFHTGALETGDRHPALAVDWPRHEKLSKVVQQALQVDETIAIKASPEFRGTIERTHDFEVRWLPI